MAWTSVDLDPQPGEAGFFDWHDRVAKGHNDLKTALDAGSDDDLLGINASNEPKRIASGTFRKTTDSMEVVNVAKKHGTTKADVVSAIADAQGGTLVFEPGTTFTGADGERVDFGGVHYVIAYGASFDTFHAIMGSDDITWAGGAFDQAGGTSNSSIFRVNEHDNIHVYDVDVTKDAASMAFEVASAGGTSRATDIFFTGCRNLSPNTTSDGFSLTDCKNVHLTDCVSETQGDDGFVIKDMSGLKTEDIFLTACKGIQIAAVCRIGSQVANLIRNVVVTNGIGEHTGALLTITPNDVGEVRGVHFNNGRLEDIDGVKTEKLVYIRALGGGTIRDVFVNNISFYGRFREGALDSELRGIQVLADGSTIENVNFNDVSIDDRLDGATTTPGKAADLGFTAGTSNGGVLNGVHSTDVAINGTQRDVFSINVSDGDCVLVRPKPRNAGQDAIHFFGDGTLLDPDWESGETRPLAVASGVSVYVRAAFTGSPEGVIEAMPGSVFYRKDGDAGRAVYVKEVGTDASGWSSMGSNAGTATFSGDGSTTTFSVPHGLAVTPAGRSVWAESAGAAGDKYVSNVTNTNIDVTFTTAPASGTDNVVLGFEANP